MQRCATQGFVLHHQDYSNTSKIIYCLTKDYGVVHILAKGAKNRKSAFFADCQPFRLIDIQFIQKTGLSILTASHTVSPIQFTETKKQFSGFYINELLYRLIKTQQQDLTLFMLYLQTMDSLADEQDIELVLRQFEYQLLSHLGYDFQQFFSHQSLVKSYYQIIMPTMQLKAIEPPLTTQGVDVFEAKFLKTLTHINAENIKKNKAQHKKLCRLMFHHLLDGKAIKSRELFSRLSSQ